MSTPPPQPIPSQTHNGIQTNKVMKLATDQLEKSRTSPEKRFELDQSLFNEVKSFMNDVPNHE